MAWSPCASSTVLNGTSHIPSAAPWIKNSATNSAYSLLRMVPSTRTERTSEVKFQEASGGTGRSRDQRCWIDLLAQVGYRASVMKFAKIKFETRQARVRA